MDWVDADKLYSGSGLSKVQKDLRAAAVNTFEAFIRLVAPYQLMAHCHIPKHHQ